MATKSYSKHKEFKEFSSSSKGTRSGTTVPYTDEAFDMMKSELIPKGSKLGEVARTGGGQREYHYEYKEEKHPSGKYDRKDLHTVEEYTVPPKTVPKNSESTSYYYEREERELPSFSTSNAAARTYNYENTTSSTPGGQTKFPKNSESTSYYYEREERELPSFSTSNAAARTYNYENTTSSTPGYSKIKSSKVTKDLSHNVEELDSLLDDLQKDQERQLYKSGYTSDTAESTSFDYKRVSTPVKAPSSGYSTLKREERMESSTWNSSPPPPPPPATRTAELRREEMYKEERHESRVVPSVSPAPLVVPQTTICHNCHQSSSTLSRSSTPMNKVTTTVKTYTYEVPADQDPASVPLPTRADHQRTYVSSHENMRTETNTSKLPASPALGCQYCSHCNTRVREYKHISTSDEHTNERMVYPSPVNEVKLLPVNAEPHNYGPTSYKFSETTYEAHNSTERYPSPAPFPRPSTPSPGNQQTPKKLDDLLADFPEARFPVTQTDGVTQRKIAVTHERSTAAATKPVAGPAVYYPPGHVPFEKKEGYQASAMQSGGAYASGKGMYEYEAGSKSKEKHSEKKTAVPICLPLCCAMPCVIM